MPSSHPSLGLSVFFLSFFPPHRPLKILLVQVGGDPVCPPPTHPSLIWLVCFVSFFSLDSTSLEFSFFLLGTVREGERQTCAVHRPTEIRVKSSCWGPVPCGIDPIRCSSAQVAGRLDGGNRESGNPVKYTGILGFAYYANFGPKHKPAGCVCFLAPRPWM